MDPKQLRIMERAHRDAQMDMFTKETPDLVHSPEHYNLNDFGIECIDAIQASMEADEFKGMLKGNVIKYLWRYRYKGKPLQDLNKAQWYLNRLVKEWEDD